MITQTAAMSNLADIGIHGAKINQGDRCVSWLPFYHDMGLVGLVLVPVATQRSVDYLSTRDFAMRPRQWLSLMSRNRASIAFSPPFGYELCVRRLREADVTEYDFSTWRIAGVGAEMIRPGPLEDFARIFSPWSSPRQWLNCPPFPRAVLDIRSLTEHFQPCQEIR